ncbi:MAG: hypothetical protein FH758_08520 [Firmicutes bacterium]|nr:hypothetical protein [Bacillota bacterium]
MDIRSIQDKIQWEFNLYNEFTRPRRKGFSFVIDVYEGRPHLALYRIGLNCSSTEILDEQPPTIMLVEALIPQAGMVIKDGLYQIDENIREWIEMAYNLDETGS